jgi:hypothetical protein
MRFMFDYLKYLGIWHNWSLRNGFLFDESISTHMSDKRKLIR